MKFLTKIIFHGSFSAVHGYVCLEYLQYSPKIMHKQELLFASAKRSLLEGDCGLLELESWKPRKNFFAVA